MSGGLAGLSDDDLMAQISTARASSGGPMVPRPTAPAQPRSSDVSGLSDDDLMAQISAARGGGGQQPSSSPAPSFDDRFGSGPMASQTNISSGLGEGMRRVADERLGGPPSATNQFAAGAMRASNALGLNLPRNAGAAAATAIGGMMGGGRSFSENYQLAGEQEEALARQYPKTALAGTVAGIGAGAVMLPTFPAAQSAGVLGRAVANFATGAAYGGAAEAFDKKTVQDTFTGGVVGGALGAGGGYLIEKAAPVVMGLFRKGVPFKAPEGGFTPEAEAALRGAGLDPAEITPDLALQLERAFTAKGPSTAAAREALAAEQGITLSRGQATLDPQAVALEQGAIGGTRGGRAQGIGEDFAAQQASEIGAARGRLQTMAAGGNPVIDNPQAAFEAAADRARFASEDLGQRATTAQRAQDDALRAVQGDAPPDALDGATAAVQGVREAAERSRGAYREAYGEVAKIPGTFAPGALDDVGARVRRSLGPEIPIDDVNTPAARSALADLDNLPAILGLREGETPTLRQVEQVRKRFSAYYGRTAQNPTDRTALNAVRNSFDERIEDLLSIGQFGERGPVAARVADDFPGLPGGAVDAPPSGAIMVPEAPRGEPESLVRFLARNGGVPLDDEARAADLNRLYVPGRGTLARSNAPSWDDLRVRLTEEGFFPYGGLDEVSPRDLADTVREMIRAERQGRPTYRMDDEARAGGRRVGERVADENADYASQVERQTRRIAIDMEGYGLRPQDLDRAALNDAAEAMIRGEADDAAMAYDRAVARRGSEVGETVPSRTVGDEVPFPDLGDGVGPATSSSLPIGDTGPAEAMRKARGLFRDYKQAFSPRGPGDVAGQRLQKIVERDASPNDAVTSLFGTTTGKISGGQLQTLDRLRSAVGQDSEAWSAVQQSIITRYVGGDGRDLSRRLDYLLRGEGRDLATRFLSDEQRRGLGQLRAAVSQTERAQSAAPAWVQSLERSGFDPNAIGASLFGSGVPGARVGAVNEARAAKSFLGETSPEWAGLRQAAVQRLTDEGLPAKKIVERIRGFTDGPGSGVAREMFSLKELGDLRRFASALDATILPNGNRRPDSDRALGAVAKAFDLIAGAVAFKAAGPAAAGAAYGARDAGRRALTGGIGATRARQSFQGGAPRMRVPVPTLDTSRFATGTGLTTGDVR